MLYHALEVTATFSKVDGRAFFVRDEEYSHLWNRVEYVGRRLQCWCDDGVAHAESPDTEPPCAHLTAVCDEQMAAQQSSRPHGVINAASFVD